MVTSELDSYFLHFIIQSFNFHISEKEKVDFNENSISQILKLAHSIHRMRQIKILFRSRII